MALTQHAQTFYEPLLVVVTLVLGWTIGLNTNDFDLKILHKMVDSAFESELVQLMNTIYQVLDWKILKVPPTQELATWIQQMTHLSLQDLSAELVDQLKIGFLWQQGKAFVEHFEGVIESAEIDANNLANLSWPTILILTFSQIAKALLRGICYSETSSEALRYIQQRRFLWLIPKRLSMAWLSGEVVHPAIQYLFMRICFDYSRLRRDLNLKTLKAQKNCFLLIKTKVLKMNKSLTKNWKMKG